MSIENAEDVIGIDPGAQGGVACIRLDPAMTLPRLVSSMPMPVRAGSGVVHGGLLAAYVAAAGVKTAVVEQVGSAPGMGVVGSFSFGRGLGVVEGVLATLGVEVQWVAPSVWKQGFRLPGGRANKAQSVAMAARVFGGDPLPEAEAEAALIAWWWLARQR